VALTDKWAIVGAYGENKAFLFQNNGGTWGTTPAFALYQNTGNTGESGFGYSVALTDQWAIVGAFEAKEAFLFKNNGGTWGTSPAFTLVPNTAESVFGNSVSLTDQWAIVGAYGANKAFLFQNNGGTWGTSPAFALDKNTGDTSFGYSVALTNKWVMAGAYSANKAFIFTRECTLGSVHNYTDTLSNPCIQCPSAKFSDKTGTRYDCTNCDPGKSNAGAGNTDCSACPAGRIVTTRAPLACEVCKGKYFFCTRRQRRFFIYTITHINSTLTFHCLIYHHNLLPFS
jgi:hypothetical protein